MQHANWMSLGIIVTHFACMVQRLASSNGLTKYASAASCKHRCTVRADMAAINFIVIYLMQFTQLFLDYFCNYTLDLMVKYCALFIYCLCWNWPRNSMDFVSKVWTVSDNRNEEFETKQNNWFLIKWQIITKLHNELLTSCWCWMLDHCSLLWLVENYWNGPDYCPPWHYRHGFQPDFALGSIFLCLSVKNFGYFIYHSQNWHISPLALS